MRRLRGDWWELNEEGTILTGERTARRSASATRCACSVERVETARGRVDLAPVEPRRRGLSAVVVESFSVMQTGIGAKTSPS